MHGSLNTLRYAIRVLLRTPGLSATVILVFALGIGATTASYSMIRVVLLTATHYTDVDRLVNVERAEQDPSRPFTPFTYAQYERLAEWEASPLESVAAYGTMAVTTTGGAEPEQLWAEFASRGYFDVLGVTPVLGRGWLREQGTEAEVVLTHAYWQRRFDGAADVLGRTITVNGRTLVVVGVMPARFRGESGNADVLIPVDAVAEVTGEASLLSPFAGWLRVVGRLPASLSPAAAEARLAGIDAQWQELDVVPVAPLQGGHLVIAPIRGSRIDPTVRQALVLVSGAAGLVLLIAALNISGLLLARAARRRREFAIILAIGGSRAQVARQLVAESMLLATLGGAVGVLLANALIDGLVLLTPAAAPGFWTHYARAVDFAAIRIDGRVLLFAFGVTVLAGQVTAMLPAWRIGRGSRPELLRQGAATAGTTHVRGQATLVILQTALALTLLTSAGLLLRSLHLLYATELGIRPENVVTARIQLPRASYDETRVRQFYTALHERLSGEAEIVSASVSGGIPLAGGRWTSDVSTGDPSDLQNRERATFAFQPITHGYLRTIGIGLLRGRDFEATEASPVVLVNQAAARALWPDGDALGNSVTVGFPLPRRTTARVIGIVDDAQYDGIGEPVLPAVYAHTSMMMPRDAFVSARLHAGGMAGFGAQLRAHVRALDPDLPIVEIRTLEQRISQATSRARFVAVLLAAFAALATLLVALGIYGILAQLATDSHREIGIRMALGGTSRAILTLFLGRGAKLIAAGLAIGMLGSAAATRLLGSQLYGVAAGDAAAWLGGLVLLAAIALGAAALPSLHAARTDPASVIAAE